jgi:hypothetical protein
MTECFKNVLTINGPTKARTEIQELVTDLKNAGKVSVGPNEFNPQEFMTMHRIDDDIEMETKEVLIVEYVTRGIQEGAPEFLQKLAGKKAHINWELIDITEMSEGSEVTRDIIKRHVKDISTDEMESDQLRCIVDAYVELDLADECLSHNKFEDFRYHVHTAEQSIEEAFGKFPNDAKTHFNEERAA